jgi:hypothetical protein
MRANRCDCCGGKFGLVLHHSWGRGFCSRHCKQVYQEQKRLTTPWTRFSLTDRRGRRKLNEGWPTLGLDANAVNNAFQQTLSSNGLNNNRPLLRCRQM